MQGSRDTKNAKFECKKLKLNAKVLNEVVHCNFKYKINAKLNP